MMVDLQQGGIDLKFQHTVLQFVCVCVCVCVCGREGVLVFRGVVEP